MGASNPGTVRRSPGGVGFNVTSILARLGVPARLVTRVGQDADGEAIVLAAKAAGIDTSALIVSPFAPTAAYHAAFDDTGDLIVGVADMTICDEITPASLEPAAIASDPNDFWVIDANLPAETIEFLTEEARANRIPVAAVSVSPAKAVKLVPILDRLTFLFTNRREAPVLLGRQRHESATVADLAAQLTGPRATSVIVTDGAEPLAVARSGEVRSFAPLRAKIVGVNGAGDSFAAGTIQGLAEGLSLHDAVRHGLAAAVLTLEAGSVAAAAFAPGALASAVIAGTRIAS